MGLIQWSVPHTGSLSWSSNALAFRLSLTALDSVQRFPACLFQTTNATRFAGESEGLRNLYLRVLSNRTGLPLDIHSMSELVDPATGQPLPADAIQRVLFVARPVHVYAIPPLTSMKGYTAADWTTPDPRNGGKSREIFIARLRIIETAIPGGDQQEEKIKTDILLEDPDSEDLFAAAPYTDPGVVEHVLDSSRFFAIRVVGEGRKAVLGIGFEDRSEAFDFGVALQEARKVLGFANNNGAQNNNNNNTSGPRGGRTTASSQPDKAPARDYSLKPGQTISVGNIGSRRRPAADTPDAQNPAAAAKEDEKALFSIPPPPGPASSSSLNNTTDQQTDGFPSLPPPPSARDARTDRRRRRPPSTVIADQKDKAKEFGFDDDFGDFQ